MSYQDDIDAAVKQLNADVALTHTIVHGDKDTEVPTDGGSVPSHAKVAADANLEIIGLLQPTVDSINDHAAFVEGKTSEAEASATAAAGSATEAAGSEQGSADHAAAALASEQQAEYWADQAEHHAGSVKNAMYYGGAWDPDDPLPPTPPDDRVPWFRVTGAGEDEPSDQLCWDPTDKQYYVTGWNQAVKALQGEVTDVEQQASDNKTALDDHLAADNPHHILVPPPGRLNFLINGDFRIWQRGDSFDTYGAFTSDRWYLAGYDSNKVKAIRNEDSVNLINTDGDRDQQTVFWQRVEMSPKRYSEVPMTFSFTVNWVVKPTSYLIVALWMKPSIEISGEVLEFPALVENGRQSKTFNLPKAPGDAAYLQVELKFSGAFNVMLSDVMLSLGPNLYPFPYTPIAEELALCQRYYEKSYDMDEPPGTNVGVDTGVYGAMLHVNCGVYNSTGVSVSTAFKATKFKTPNVTTFSSSGLSGQASTNLGAKLSSVSLGQNAFHVGISDIQYFGCHWTADAEIN